MASRANEVNKIILDKIKSTETTSGIKHFLTEAMFFELENSDRHNPNYNARYRQLLLEGVSKDKK